MSAQLTPWTFGEAGDLRQTFEWRTDVIAGRRGSEQRRCLRLSPRQRLRFDVLPDPRPRRYLETLLWANGGAFWDVPLPMHALRLEAPLPAGSAIIAAAVAAPAFVAGGRVLLVGDDPQQFEVLTVDAVLPEQLVLLAPIAGAWPPGTRLVPLRRGRMPKAPRVPRFTGDAALVTAEFLLAEPVDYAASFGASTYRGMPVLEIQPTWSADPEYSPERDITVVDEETGPQVLFDLVGMPRTSQKLSFSLAGQPEIDAFVSLVHALAGRWKAIWLPTFARDLHVVADVAAASLSIDIENAGITARPGGVNRTDLRIELHDGTVFYRRVESSAVVDAHVERLTLDVALGQAVGAQDVAAVSFLWLGRLEADVVTLSWWSSDVVLCDLTFRGFRHDL